MCGIAAIVSNQSVNQDLYDALTVLQHRGQDAAGIVTCDGSRLHLRKDNGLARDVFSSKQMMKLKGNMGIAHVRYPTAGCTSSAEAQPFYVNSPFGLTLAHNGNLTNTEELKYQVFMDDQRHINTDSDSEVLLNVFAHELAQFGKLKLTVDDVFQAVSSVHKRIRGAYAVVVMIAGFGVLGFRDPHGIRPIVFGKRKTEDGTDDYMIASESVALDVLDFQLIRDIEPGEAVFIEAGGQLHTRQCTELVDHCPCIFEYVYFARPDSIIDNISVYKARMRMGRKLAEKIQREWPNHDIDVVIPIPDTSRTAASQIAHDLGVKFREGFMKNRYIGRTFIMPGQKMRKKSVKQKLNAISLEFDGKNVLLVDDSIVRGTTSEQIIQMARDAGAKKVYFASAAPPVRYPNVYGIDMPAAHELIAHDRTEEEICQALGADKLIYQSLDDLIEAVGRGNPDIKHFDTSCFSHDYITGDIDDAYLARIEALRNDNAQELRNSGSFIIEMQVAK
ncbi:amidophosphoribosyltransferase [Methylomonas fluvii]|uniref:Amidophosphoribosyltransferase n=1 Tax=Methylomonas fluvii TaxID=1854564 RepID=A0ABR9DKG5_9GAMM|nr:amidophosphoribosyltransferase [Methylomonas fluvii]MBD9363311.1 amidophosphoribosyltransferase [Methylomonas fluvii]CAD6876576.1 Amidophosphoribosyltransferase (EC 2.4.2.14) [Methylomonas fluvii]